MWVMCWVWMGCRLRRSGVVGGAFASAILFGVGAVDVCFGWNSVGNSVASAGVGGGDGAEFGGDVCLLFTDDCGGWVGYKASLVSVVDTVDRNNYFAVGRVVVDPQIKLMA